MPPWTVDGLAVAFPRDTALPGRCDEPLAVVDGVAYCRRAPCNVLLVRPPSEPFEGWRPVGARRRWAELEGQWRPNDASYQRVGQHRWWGLRDHLRLWWGPDRAYAIGQAHREDWAGVLPRRHRVLELNAARDAVADGLAGGPHITHRDVGTDRTDWDGRVLVAVWPG